MSLRNMFEYIYLTEISTSFSLNKTERKTEQNCGIRDKYFAWPVKKNLKPEASVPAKQQRKVGGGKGGWGEGKGGGKGGITGR
jgi:hypothetical protein